MNYNKLEKGIKIRKLPVLNPPPTNFKQNLEKSIHRWYNFKEGFSHQLVYDFLNEFKINDKDTIVDPFCGSSTTILSAQEKGIRSTGIEINPFLAFVGNIKIHNNYNTDKIRGYLKMILKSKFSKYSPKRPLLSTFERVFTPHALKKILNYKKKILTINELKYRKLFLFVLASIIEKASKVRKTGKGLKFIQNKPEPVEELFIKKLNDIIEDIEELHNKTPYQKTLGKIYNKDARDLNFLENKSHTFALFSPPYLNTFDYTEVYKMESWLLDFIKNYNDFRKLSKSTIRSHLSGKFEDLSNYKNKNIDFLIKKLSKKDLWNDKIPFMIKAYFYDMEKVFSEIYRVLKKGSYCIFVVGNSSYSGIPIATDLLLGKVAENTGFKLKEIRIARKLNTSSQQLKKTKSKKYLRESIVVLQK